MSKLLALAVLLVSLSFFAAGCATKGDSGGYSYKRIPKAEHERMYPAGHQGGDAEKCFAPTQEEVYFCAW